MSSWRHGQEGDKIVELLHLKSFSGSHPVEMLLTVQVLFQILALLGNQLKIGFSFFTAPYTCTLNLFEAEVHATDVYTSYAD